MKTIDRRAMLGSLLGGAAVITSGLVLTLGQAVSAPLSVSKPEGVTPESPIAKSVFVSGRRRPRSRRRTRCAYHHGKKVCATH